ncbi:MFS transporter [Arvimicrobium flavum]|uniref:MFS transporter n=1 Tax=Arvimicrobium flavum TaxID=3393320 RepID=UPI00237B6063|nr:MFS transporter [Mesorhizobium shangrilense]
MQLTALSSTSFRLYIAANFVSVTGIWVNRVVIGWFSWALTESATWVGVVSFLLFAPTLFAGPFFGVLADRIDIKRGALATQALLAMLMLALGILFAHGILDIWMLSGLSFLFGLTSSANTPIRLTLIPMIVPREALANAITLISINFNAARLIGPAIGGVMLEKIDPGSTIAASIVMTLPMLVALAFLKPRAREVASTEQAGIAGQLVEAVRHVCASNWLVQAMIVTTITAVVARGVLEVLPAVADGMYHRGASGLGQMLSAAGVGALISGISITFREGSRPHLEQLRQSYLWMMLGILAVFAMGLADSWLLALGLVALMGASGTFTAIATQSVMQLETPDAYRGSTIGLWLFAGIGGNALGAIAFGAMADALTMRTTLLALGAIGTLAAAAAWLWSRVR